MPSPTQKHHHQERLDLHNGSQSPPSYTAWASKLRSCHLLIKLLVYAEISSPKNVRLDIDRLHGLLFTWKSDFCYYIKLSPTLRHPEVLAGWQSRTTHRSCCPLQ